MEERIAPTFPLIRIRGSATVREAAQLISDLSIGALGVDGPDHVFIGLFTERDLAWTIAQGRDPLTTKVEEVVNDLPVVVDGPITISEAARRMTDAHVRHLLIRTDEELRIVSMRNLIRDYVESQPGHATHTASAAEMRRWYSGASSTIR
ncbi:MAG: cyclic nucleotide-binding/CBS domain-containing protein [Actinomycetota bacterium]